MHTPSSNNLSADDIRKMLCDILRCQDFCPQNGCEELREKVEKAKAIMTRALQELSEWEEYTPWPD